MGLCASLHLSSLPQTKEAIRGAPAAAESTVLAREPFSGNNNDYSQPHPLEWKLQLCPADRLLRTSGSGRSILLRCPQIGSYNSLIKHSRDEGEGWLGMSFPLFSHFCNCAWKLSLRVWSLISSYVELIFSTLRQMESEDVIAGRDPCSIPAIATECLTDFCLTC